MAAKRRTPFRSIVNEALRIGLHPAEKPALRRPCRTVPKAMGLRRGRDLDNIQPCVRLIRPTGRHWTLFQNMLVQGKAAAHRVADAHLAALALEHDCELYSTDADFSRFPRLRWRNPLAS